MVKPARIQVTADFCLELPKEKCKVVIFVELETPEFKHNDCGKADSNTSRDTLMRVYQQRVVLFNYSSYTFRT